MALAVVLGVCWVAGVVVLGFGLNRSFYRSDRDFAKEHQAYRSRKVVDETAEVDLALVLLAQPDRLWWYCTTQVMFLLCNGLLVLLLVAGMLFFQHTLGWVSGMFGFLLLVAVLNVVLRVRRFFWMANLYLFARDRRDARVARENL